MLGHAQRILLAGALATTTVSAANASPVGVMADVGVPDGAIASIVYRPIARLRVEAGAGYNLVSTGARGGLTLLPFTGWATPTLSADVGWYREGDANSLARMLTGDPSYSSQLLEQVGYTYTNAHAGIELGTQHARFYLRAGVSRVTSELAGTSTTSEDANTMVVTSSSQLTLWSVSGRLGFIVYLP